MRAPVEAPGRTHRLQGAPSAGAGLQGLTLA